MATTWIGDPIVVTSQHLACALEIADVVEFHGYQVEAARFSRAFDVQAVPSAAEPFGLVTLEAMIRRVPVVATVSGGSREIIRDGVDGLLVTPGDPRALAAALAAILADTALAGRLAEAGRRRVESCSRWTGRWRPRRRVTGA